MGPVPDTRTLQFIDRWIGMIVCWFLSRIRALEDLLRHQDFTGKPSRIIFVKFAEQGSTVLAFRAIERAKAMVGAENVYFLVFQENRFILDAMNLIPKENVVTIRHRNLLDLAIQALVALYRVRRLRIDAAIDLEFFARSSASLTYLTGAKSRVGFHAFFWGRSIPRRPDDSPGALQSAFAHESDLPLARGGIGTGSETLANLFRKNPGS